MLCLCCISALTGMSNTTGTRRAGIPGDGRTLPLRRRASRLGAQKVFYAGLQKTGTTSFHALSKLLQLNTLHDTWGVYNTIHFPQHTLCQGSRPSQTPRRCDGECECTCSRPVAAGRNRWGAPPHYAQAARDLTGSVLDQLIDRHDTFADHPWPFLLPWLSMALPEAKFVWWPRPAHDWVTSVISYDGDGDARWHHGSTLLRRGFLFAFGECFVTNSSAMALLRAYEKHAQLVLGLAAAQPHRWLVINFTDANAARRVCSFIFSNSSKPAMVERACAQFDGSPMPHKNIFASSRRSAINAHANATT